MSYLAPNPTYTSGEIVGGNYKIKFDSQGYATSITTLDGGSVSDSAGNNWINVSEIWVYWKGLYDLSDHIVMKNTPQIGLTGLFSSGAVSYTHLIPVEQQRPSRHPFGRCCDVCNHLGRLQ